MIECLDKLYLTLAMHVQNFIEEEKGAVDLITIVVLIGIAIALAVVFKNQMKGIIEALLGQILGSGSSAIEGF